MFASNLKAAALALAAAVSSTPASAQDGTGEGEWQIARISYADLDLRTPAGVSRLERRVRRAAANLCNSGVHPLSLAARRRGLECRAEAIARAQPQVAQAVGRRTQLAQGGDPR